MLFGWVHLDIFICAFILLHKFLDTPNSHFYFKFSFVFPTWVFFFLFLTFFLKIYLEVFNTTPSVKVLYIFPEGLYWTKISICNGFSVLSNFWEYLCFDSLFHYTLLLICIKPLFRTCQWDVTDNILFHTKILLLLDIFGGIWT